MSEKRRDNKGRILRTGESQRTDGRYMYKYVNRAGETKVVYSWKLVPTDRVPKGKRDAISLREKEREIQRNLEGNRYQRQVNDLMRAVCQKDSTKKQCQEKHTDRAKVPHGRIGTGQAGFSKHRQHSTV